MGFNKNGKGMERDHMGLLFKGHFMGTYGNIREEMGYHPH
jgi:hypothetical protein